jgi:hypothetical protein
MAKKDETKEEQSAAAKVPALRIKAKVASFRRAGLTFGVEPTDVPLASLKKDQVAALKAEPMLTVEEIEIEA